MKKLLLLACALLSVATVPAFAEEIITPVKRPRQMRKKQPVQVVEEDEEADVEEEAPAPRVRKKKAARVVEEDEEEEAPAPRKRRRGGYEPAYESSYSESYAPVRTSHWQVGMDLFGPALAYSFGGSYLFGDHLAVNAGLSAFSVDTGSTSASVFLVPLSVSGLFGGPDHHFEATGGLTPVFGSAKTTNTDGGKDRAAGADLFGFGGIGYRYWPAMGGFHFRATGYVMAGGGNVFPWLGFQFGYAF